MRVGFTFNKKNLISRFITKETNSSWSHCFLILQDIGDDSLIAEASFGGVEFSLLSKYGNKDKYNLEIIDLGDVMTKESNNEMLSLIGKPYGYLELLGNLVARIFHMQNNPITDAVVCSEYVDQVLRVSKLSDKFQDTDPNLITPGDIYKILKKED